ncbi:hypothetical protein GCM10009801_75390 [Streptomyces albiaxialis]|uniref:HEAT repeat domain-containing protein n=1 Tax=Streptomyces albiaxialis TaxID=329523 RepID=A0ABN2X1E2_9ACTN
MATLFSAVAAVVALQVQDRQNRKEVDVTRQGQITDRFNNAVDNLGDKADEVRLGGIFALRRIMEDSPRDQPAVVDVLSAYVRTHAPAAGAARPKRDASGRPAPDVQAAFETLARRRTHRRRSEGRGPARRPAACRPPKDDDKNDGSGTKAPAPEQPARVSVEQLLEARLDHTSEVPSALEDDSRLRKRLSRAHKG